MAAAEAAVAAAVAAADGSGITKIRSLRRCLKLLTQVLAISDSGE